MLDFPPDEGPGNRSVVEVSRSHRDRKILS
jgi:hypothetical protein